MTFRRTDDRARPRPGASSRLARGAIAAAAVWLAVAPPAALALSLGGLGVRPARSTPTGWFIYELPPGASTTDAVYISNDQDQPVTVRLAPVDYEPTDIGAFGLKGMEAEQTGIGKWVQLSTTTFTLLPGESREVQFTLAIPPNADAGEHAGAISVSPTQPRQSSKFSGAFITTRVSARIYNTIPGELVRQIKLLGFSVVEDEVTAGADRIPVYRFNVEAKNEGNVTVMPRLVLHLDGWGLVKVPSPGDPELADYPGLALFGLQRFLPKEKATDWQLARDATVQTSFTWRKPYLGRFTAYVTLEYERTPSNPETIRSETLRFTILPWPATGYALGALGLLAALLVAWFIWRKVHYSGRRWQTYTVRAGDTLTLLAAKCGVSWKRLAKVNKLKKPYVVAVDDKILVPASAKLPGERPGAKAAGKPADEKPATGKPKPTRRWPRWLTLGAIIAASVVTVAVAALLFFRSTLKAPRPAAPAAAPVQPPLPATLPAAAAPEAATTTATTTPPVVAAPAKDTLKLAVLNGSGIAGLAAQVAETFRQAGYQQVSAGNADAYSYQGVTIRYGPGLKGAAEDLATRLRDRYQKFTLEERATTTAADITVILGAAGTP